MNMTKLNPTESQLHNAMREWLFAEGFNPDVDDSFLKLADKCGYFNQNWRKIANLKKHVQFEIDMDFKWEPETIGFDIYKQA